MIANLLTAFVFVFAIQSIFCAPNTPNKGKDAAKILQNSSYYDPATGLELTGKLEYASKEEMSTSRIGYRGVSCECENLTCSCCVGVNVKSLNFHQKACTRFVAHPQDRAINMSVSMDDLEIYVNTLSAKNPPLLCLPFAPFPAISFCVRFFDVRIVERNFHVCMDFETHLITSPILILHFNCVNLGTSGISVTRPEDKPSTTATMLQIEDAEPYDDVDFEEDPSAYSNNSSTASPEDELLIGQHKLKLL